MEFSHFKKKAKGFECLGPSSVADAASYSNSCNLSLWMNTRYKAPVDHEFLAKWELRHAAVLNHLKLNILDKFPHAEIDMELPLQSVNLCGNTLFGVPDAICRFPNGQLMVCDAKSGKKRVSHWIQVGLYGHMIQGLARAKGAPIPDIYGFALCYGNFDQEGGFNKNNIEFLTITGPQSLAEVLPEPTRKRIREILSISGSDDLPLANPNSQNCRFCKWKIGCDQAFQGYGNKVVDVSEFF
tara:strand:+ start:6 stop:728 length:723 start_codon:yes stop_codon:yes gene_type:complete